MLVYSLFVFLFLSVLFPFCWRRGRRPRLLLIFVRQLGSVRLFVRSPYLPYIPLSPHRLSCRPLTRLFCGISRFPLFVRQFLREYFFGSFPSSQDLPWSTLLQPFPVELLQYCLLGIRPLRLPIPSFHGQTDTSFDVDEALVTRGRTLWSMDIH